MKSSKPFFSEVLLFISIKIDGLEKETRIVHKFLMIYGKFVVMSIRFHIRKLAKSGSQYLCHSTCTTVPFTTPSSLKEYESKKLTKL